jgi:hypothetical protein
VLLTGQFVDARDEGCSCHAPNEGADELDAESA